MNKTNDFILGLYKPFRNQIRNYYLLDSLYLIWGYSRNFTFNLPFPIDIEKPSDFNPHNNIDHRRYRGIPEFEQEFLFKEFILNCDTVPTKKTLKHKDKLAKLINYLRFSLNDEIDKHYTIKSDFFLEFNRMAHRQFIWQTGYNQNVIFRHYKIYSNAEVAPLIFKKFNLTTWELFILGFFFFRWTGEHFRTKLPFTSKISLLTNDMIETFFKHFSITIEQAKKELKECQEMNENLFYSYNPLLARPILIYQNTFSCPIQLLLFWQITSGIYYSIVKEPGFENAFGNSFQSYIGEVLYKCCNQAKLEIKEEKKYGKEEKRTTDWIVTDDNAVLFIECKTKRMTIVSKSELNIEKGLELDLKKMSLFITQLYKTYLDYREGKYPHLTFDPSKKFIPLVATLEPWYINMNPKILGLLKNFVVENLIANNIDASIIDKFPYHIRSSEDFEKDIQLINSLGILGYFNKIETNELNDYIQDFNYSNVFEGDFEKIFVEPLRQKK